MKTCLALAIAIALIGVLLFSCTKDMPPAPERDNPDDGRNPDFVPEITDIIIGDGSGQSENPAQIRLIVNGSTGAIDSMMVGQVSDSGEAYSGQWQAYDSVFTFDFIGDTTLGTQKWVSAKIKSCDGDEGASRYKSFILGINAPSNLRIINPYACNFTIEWDDNSNIETGFSVEKNQDNTSFVELAIIGENMENYSENIDSVGTYIYRVRAKKDNMYSVYSNSVEYLMSEFLPINGLVLFFPFDNFADNVVGNYYDGTKYGDVISTTDRFSANSKAYYFSGSEDYIEFSFTPMLTLESLTLCAWVKFETGGSNNPRVIEQNDGNFLLCTNSTSSQRSFSFKIGSSVITTQTTFTSDVWYFVCGIKDQSLMKLYINTTPSSSSNCANSISLLGVVNIARKPSNTLDDFKGTIDDIRIYNRALTDAEIEILYHEGGWIGN
jgi:hypothetical protein